MRMRITVVFWCLCFGLLLGITPLSYADNADVVPKGIWSFLLETSYFLPTTHRFDDDGEVEPIDEDFNTNLDSAVFTGLAALDPFVVGPPASLGNSEVSLEISRAELYFTLAYGVTDKLTVGARVPYLNLRNKVDARLNTSTANVGKSALANSLAPLSGPFAPPDVVPLTTEDIQGLLGEGLDITGDGTIEVPGLGYERFGTWSDWGIGDIEAGFKYQYFKSEDWRLAFMLAARLPTGEVDDPDNLTDLSFGEGQWDILFRLHNDYTGFKNWVLSSTFKYDHQLPDHEVKRVLEDVNQPLVPKENKENVKRDLGDIFECEVSATYMFREVFSARLLYSFAYKGKDDIDGSRGLNYEALEDETRAYEHIIKPGISFSTIPWFVKKTFPFPFTVSLDYRNKFAGMNVFKSQYIYLSLVGYF